MQTRRQFSKMMAATIPAAALTSSSSLWAAPKLDSTVRGVKLGIITGSINPGRPPAGGPPSASSHG